MYLSELRQAIMRCWYVAVLGLVVSAAIVLGALRLVPAQYETKAEILLLPPQTTTGAGGNPYLSLGGLQSTADVVARSVMTEDVVASVRAGGGSDRFVVETDRTTSGPLMLVTVTDPDRQLASRTLSLVVAAVPQTLNDLQAASDVKPSFRITSEVITSQKEPLAGHKSQVRAAIVALAAGLVGSLGAVSLTDSLVSRRRRRAAHVGASDAAVTRRGRRSPGPGPASSPEPLVTAVDSGEGIRSASLLRDASNS